MKKYVELTIPNTRKASTIIIFIDNIISIATFDTDNFTEIRVRNGRNIVVTQNMAEVISRIKEAS